MKTTTIAAISTPLGPGGIGIVRISGPKSLDILKRVFVRHRKKGSTQKTVKTEFRSHQVYYGKILDAKKGTYIDEALAIFMRAPKSFTREDVVELQSHSGFLVLERILNVVLENGAIVAQAGEFTKRAFLNGRIDLSQAEAVIDMINAPCEKAVHMASQQMDGLLKRRVGEIRSGVVALRARLEVDLEFSEVGDTQILRENLSRTIQKEILPEIERLIKAQKNSAIYRDGILLSIAGIPNVGKSSLLNQLVQKEIALVSEVPGTTRDIVREYFTIRGIPIVLCDTAGLHDSADPVECMGIEKARDQIQESHTILFVLDASRTVKQEEIQLIESLKTKRVIFLINKKDIADGRAVSDIKKLFQNESVLEVSTKTGEGIEDLKDRIFHGIIKGGGKDQGDVGFPNLRQRKLLERAGEMLRQQDRDIINGIDEDLVSEGLKDVIGTLEEISGSRDREDLYDSIFSQFCIGK